MNTNTERLKFIKIRGLGNWGKLCTVNIRGLLTYITVYTSYTSLAILLTCDNYICHHDQQDVDLLIIIMLYYCLKRTNFNISLNSP